MTLEELKVKLDGDTEAISLLNDIESTQNALTKRVNVLETDSAKAFETRDRVKGEMTKLLSKLGLSEASEEAIEKLLKGKGGDDAELQNLKTQLEKAVNEKVEVENTYKAKLSTFALKSELTKTGLAQKALNGEVYAILEQLALDGAAYTDDGKIVYRNPDGSTKYANGKEMSLEDRVQELSTSASYASLFKPTGTGGSGTKPSTTTTSTSSESKPLSAVEKMNAGRKPL